MSLDTVSRETRMLWLKENMAMDHYTQMAINTIIVNCSHMNDKDKALKKCAELLVKEVGAKEACEVLVQRQLCRDKKAANRAVEAVSNSAD